MTFFVPFANYLYNLTDYFALSLSLLGEAAHEKSVLQFSCISVDEGSVDTGPTRLLLKYKFVDTRSTATTENDVLRIPAFSTARVSKLCVAVGWCRLIPVSHESFFTYKIQFRNDRCRLPRTNYRLLHNKLCIVDFAHGDKNISFEPARFFAYLCSHPPDQWGIVECSKTNQRLLMGDITRSDVPSGKFTGLPCFFALSSLQMLFQEQQLA